MNEIQDKGFTYNVSLQVFKECRQSLLEDSEKIDATIRQGLHSSGTEQKLYFEQYFVNWLDIHWNRIDEILKQEKYTDVLTRDKKKEDALFFAQYFKNMIDSYDENSVFCDVVIPNYLKMKKKCLSEMLNFCDKWEDYYETLKADHKAHKDQVRQEIEKLLDEKK